MNSSRFEVLLSVNSSAEMSDQGKHIICGLELVYIFIISRSGLFRMKNVSD